MRLGFFVGPVFFQGRMITQYTTSMIFFLTRIGCTRLNFFRIFSNQHRVQIILLYFTILAQIYTHSSTNICLYVPYQVSLRSDAFCSHQQTSAINLAGYLITPLGSIAIVHLNWLVK